MCMRIKLENGVLLNGQQPGSAVNSFIDLGKFAVINLLSGRTAQHCDKHQFRTKMSTQTIFEMSLLNMVLTIKKQRNEKWHFHIAHFCIYLPFVKVLGNYMNLADR